MTDAVKKNGINFGIIVGGVSVLASTLMYVIDLKLFVSWWVGIVLFLISLSIGIIGIGKAKKEMGGFITFKEAFTTFFIIMAIGVAISIAFNIILLNFIDPDAKETIKDHLIEMTMEINQKFDTPAEIVKQQMEEIQNNDPYSPQKQALSYVWILLFYIVVGLIVAVSMKKNKPEFE